MQVSANDLLPPKATKVMPFLQISTFYFLLPVAKCESPTQVQENPRYFTLGDNVHELSCLETFFLQLTHHDKVTFSIRLIHNVRLGMWNETRQFVIHPHKRETKASVFVCRMIDGIYIIRALLLPHHALNPLIGSS